MRVRALHLDDSALDAELVAERLRAAGDLEWEIVHVASGEAFEAALHAQRFDLVLTDYAIPGYNGMAAIAACRALHPDVPVIVVSGTLSEEDAVSCLKAGATDYLFKQRLHRLPAATRRALDEAAERRKRRQAETTMQELSMRLRELAENSNDVIWIGAGNPPRDVFVGASAQRLWGRPAEWFLDRPGRWLETIHPEDRERVAATFNAVLEGRLPQYEAEYRIVRPDGTIRWVVDSGVRMSPGEDGEVHISGVTHDVTERREAENEVRRLNADLERQVEQRTQELRAFTYSVTHDLRAPLHAIHGFAQALAEGYARNLDEQGRHYLRRIVAGSERMDRLIEDMLSLSRITNAELVARSIDLTQLAEEVLAEVREGDRERRARVTVERGMSAHADPSLVRIALHNLLGNAWKFTGKREEAVIEVGRAGRHESGLAVFYVRDNGAGFDPSRAERLFDPFARLHSESEFPGSGVGLAIVKRAIQRHGGALWADSRPEAGATFFFTLPAGEAGESSGSTGP